MEANVLLRGHHEVLDSDAGTDQVRVQRKWKKIEGRDIFSF